MRRPWTRSTKISLAVWFVAVLLQAAALGVTYLRYSGQYVTTSNAQVDGTKVSIIAPVDGTLIKWDIGQGSVVSPGQGWVAVDMVRQGQWVSTGTTLALAFQSDIYVTARVPTDIINDVHLGAP